MLCLLMVSVCVCLCLLSGHCLPVSPGFCHGRGRVSLPGGLSMSRRRSRCRFAAAILVASVSFLSDPCPAAVLVWPTLRLSRCCPEVVWSAVCSVFLPASEAVLPVSVRVARPAACSCAGVRCPVLRPAEAVLSLSVCSVRLLPASCLLRLLPAALRGRACDGTLCCSPAHPGLFLAEGQGKAETVLHCQGCVRIEAPG